MIEPMNGRFAGAIVAVMIICVLPSLCTATVEFARQTGLQCVDCHRDPAGGGPLTKRGEKFLTDLKLKGLYHPLSKAQRIVRFFIGYVHLLIAIAWFGTILYVHILLKPAYASKGLPKGELMLGWISMILLLITGTLLTISRIPSWEMLYTTRFGILLSIKILLFLIMFISALIVTVFIGPRLRRQRHAVNNHAASKEYTLDELLSFDGRGGRSSYIAYRGILYDVSRSRFWKNGSHMVKHQAGRDLTDALKMAPHDENKLLAMPRAGKVRVEAGEPARPFHERLFYFFAYMNLAFVFLIAFIIALWRWEF
jgi:predicted heme/steroid binding protein